MATLTQKIATIRSVFNVSTGPFANQVAAWFAAHPGIIVQSIAYKRPDSTYTADEQMLRVAYLEASGSAIGGIWESRLYQTVGSTTAEDDFNAAYEVGIAIPIIPVFLLDITDHERARTGPESLLVIGIRTDVGPLGEVGYDRAVYIANPLNDIPAGMVGNALLLDASGATVSASIPITNVGLVPWIQNQRNYVVYDELEGVYIGIPTCCGASVWAPPMETTTTAFPCPANFPEPNPTTTFTTSTTTSTTSTTSTSTTTTSTTSTSTTTSSTTSTSSTTTTSTTSTTTAPSCPCFNAQPNVVVSGLTMGAASANGSYTNTDFPSCPSDVPAWHWQLAIPGGTATITYTYISPNLSPQVFIVIVGTEICNYVFASPTLLTCIDGVLTGSVNINLTCSTAGSQTATLTFG